MTIVLQAVELEDKRKGESAWLQRMGKIAQEKMTNWDIVIPSHAYVRRTEHLECYIRIVILKYLHLISLDES